MKQINISVVVCTYNREEMLRRALESLIRQKTDGEFSYEILVIDDASTDGTSGVVKEVARYSQVPTRHVREEGHGVACARNRGIDESSGEWVAFFDDDQLAEPDWLKELFALASETGAHCLGGARLLYLSEEDLSQLAPICRMFLGESVRRNKPEKCRRTRFPSSGNILIKRTVFDDVGLFDESLILGGEDIEFFARVRMAGFEAWYAPGAVVHHLIPSYRLKESYLFWVAPRYGACFAYRDYKEWGLARMTLACIARVGQALLVHMPILFWAYLLGDDAEVLARKCYLWQAVGYTRKTLFLIAPRIFVQKSYFSRLEFRKERNIFNKDSIIPKRSIIKNEYSE